MRDQEGKCFGCDLFGNEDDSLSKIYGDIDWTLGADRTEVAEDLLINMWYIIEDEWEILGQLAKTYPDSMRRLHAYVSRHAQIEYGGEE